MSDEDARTVWVGNLDPGRITEEILYELFLQAGPLQFVRHAKDRTSGEKKTFAFVCYRSESAVPYAIRLFNGTKLFGRPLKVKNRELEEQQRGQGRNGQLMGEGIHTLCPTEAQYQQSSNKYGSQSHRGNQASADEMQRQMNMCIAAAGLMGHSPLIGGGMMLGNNSLMGSGGMMPSQGYQPSHMKPSPSRNNRNDGRNYGGGSSRYLDNESMKNIKKQFDKSDRSSSHQQGRNFNYNRLGPRTEDDLGGPVGRGNDYNRSRQNDFNRLDPHVEDTLGGPIGKGNDYNRSRQNDHYGRNLDDYRNNGKSPDGRREHNRDDNRGNYSRHERHDNRHDYNRGDYHNRGHQNRNSPYDRQSRR